MYTLKIYRNGPLSGGRSVILEAAGFWIDHCDGGVKHIRAFKKKVGVEDEEGTFEAYVGGNPTEQQTRQPPPESNEVRCAILLGTGGNYYDWGVIENAYGKTTEMLR